MPGKRSDSLINTKARTQQEAVIWGLTESSGIEAHRQGIRLYACVRDNLEAWRPAPTPRSYSPLRKATSGYQMYRTDCSSPKASKASIKLSIVFSSFRPMTGRSFQNRESSENLGRDSSAGSDRHYARTHYKGRYCCDLPCQNYRGSQFSVARISNPKLPNHPPQPIGFTALGSPEAVSNFKSRVRSIKPRTNL